MAVGLLVCALGVALLVRTGLEDADRWASVIGVFLNLAGVVVAAYSAVQARRAATAVPTASGDVDNRIGGGRFHGPVVMGRDMRGIVLPPPTGQQPDADGPAR